VAVLAVIYAAKSLHSDLAFEPYCHHLMKLTPDGQYGRICWLRKWNGREWSGWRSTVESVEHSITMPDVDVVTV